MISKVEMINHVNNVQLLVLVFLAKLIEDFYFNHSLLVKSSFISNDFDGNHVATLMIDSFDN